MSVPKKIQLKKGELLFKEGDPSRSMYFLKSGMIRIFKNKGKSSIEIETIHSGQILGELAFLDGNPRSASGEALSNCDLMEITSDQFTQALKIMPDWLKLLLKTVVMRLRNASSRIKQLETASSAYDYSDGKNGTKNYVFLSWSDVLKACTGVLLVGTRYGEETPSGNLLKTSILERYANQVMGVPVAKITTVLDCLSRAEIIGIDTATGGQIAVKDLGTLERYISWQNEQNMKEEGKRQVLNLKEFTAMTLIHKNLGTYPDEKGVKIINVAEIMKMEATNTGKEQFNLEEVVTLAKFGYCSQPNLVSASDVKISLKEDEFRQVYKMQKIVKIVEAANQQKNAVEGRLKPGEAA